jgi:ribosome-binding factor A
LSVARVYFSLLKPDDDPEPVLDGLQRAAGFLRRRLGNELKVRHVPELRFVHDDSIAHGAAISKLIQDARDADDD